MEDVPKNATFITLFRRDAVNIILGTWLGSKKTGRAINDINLD